MMASKKGYRDIINFSDDLEMRPSYYGLIARGKVFYISHYINVNEGHQVIYKLTAAEAAQIKKDWNTDGWSLKFVERWITGTVT